MTLPPDKDAPLSHSHDEPGQVEGVAATEGIASADAAQRTDEDLELETNRTAVEDSPTGHS